MIDFKIAELREVQDRNTPRERIIHVVICPHCGSPIASGYHFNRDRFYTYAWLEADFMLFEKPRATHKCGNCEGIVFVPTPKQKKIWREMLNEAKDD